ncbi:MAG TPA: hypothetical protein VHX62_11185 [Solirubrobacteraceae bacterium]|jgi:hypothetical protein|nr:hypothetical protein [Solirubrobacteraceae bacterium]
MRRLAALAAGLLVIAVLVVAQLVLPGIAAQRLRDQLARSGQVLSVKVSAFPAIKLLWHRADTVVVRLGRYRPRSGKLAGALDQAADVGTLTASAQEVDDGLLAFHDATLIKRGDRLTGTATVSDAQLRSAIPILTSVTPVASAGGRLTLRGTASLFGLSATIDATVSAQDGKLIVAPDVPFGGFATLTLFADPRLSVQSVSAAPAPGGFTVRGTAVLH